MEGFDTTQFDYLGIPLTKKRRTHTSRRPRLQSQLFSDTRYVSSLLPSTSASQHPSKSSSFDGNDSSSNTKELNLHRGVSRDGGDEADVSASTKGKGGNVLFSDKRSIECVLALANKKTTNIKNGESQISKQSAVSSGTPGNESKAKKVLKLKVGGVTRTIHANSSSGRVSQTDCSARGSRSSEVSRPQKRHNQQGNFDIDDDQSPLDRKNSISVVQQNEFSKRDLSFGKQDTFAEKMAGKKISKSEAVRKGRRMPKRRVVDGEFDDEDDEIRYLEKLKSAKITAGRRHYEEESGVKRKFSTISIRENTGATTGFGKDGKKKARSDRASEDTDYEEEEERITDGETELKKKQRKESAEPLVDRKREISLTTRQRALQSSKDGSSDQGTGLIEFPNGLPPAPPKKQKEKLSDVEQQLKKAEAAQRRRMQVEKAARESEAEAIRKILGQDSDRKKREEQKKRQEVLAQEKAANELLSQLNCIRLVMGPNGTTVTFPKDTGFPDILDSKPCSYPPPREKCAGPSCPNAYKYRDSKTKLPLCSLQCYKAIHGKMKDGLENVF